MHTYTPGYARAKDAVLILSLVAMVAGFAQCFPAIRALATGHCVFGTVVSVSKLRPGLPDEIYRTTQAIPMDPNPEAEFVYVVEFNDATGNLQVGHLNIVSTHSAAYRVSDSIAIASLSKNPAEAFAIADFGTWVPGGLMVLFGFATALTFGMLRARANVPIDLPPDTPPFVGSKLS